MPFRDEAGRPDAVSDRQDTIRRISAVGKLLNLTSEAELVKLADVLLSVDRARLMAAREDLKRRMGDWNRAELDDWWGTMLRLRRVQGIDETDNQLSDAVFTDRVRKYMRAANMGCCPEAVRLAAEAGSGALFRATEDAGRVLLVPLEELNPAQRAGVYETVRRIANAKLSFAIGDYEPYEQLSPIGFSSGTHYVGVEPSSLGASGPDFDVPNQLAGAFSTEWQEAGPGAIIATKGVPSRLPEGGVWHTGPLGAGTAVTLLFNSVAERVTNRVSAMVSPGAWGVELSDDSGVLSRSRFFADGWRVWHDEHEMRPRSDYSLKLTNLSPSPNPLFLKELYMGARVTAENRELWNALGQETGNASPTGVLDATASSINSGGRWISEMKPTRDSTEPLVLELAGTPVPVFSLVFVTQTPGALFTVESSTQNAGRDEVTEWSQVPGRYRMVNGRVAIHRCVARHLRLTFTNLSAVQLREWDADAE